MFELGQQLGGIPMSSCPLLSVFEQTPFLSFFWLRVIPLSVEPDGLFWLQQEAEAEDCEALFHSFGKLSTVQFSGTFDYLDNVNTI